MDNPIFEDVFKHNAAHFTFLQSIAHCAPGVATLLALLALKPLADIWNYPPLMAFTLAVLIVDLPLLLGILFFQGKRRNGRYSLQGIVLYREKIPWWKFLGVLLLAVVLAVMIGMLGAPADKLLSTHVFNGLPAWMQMGNPAQYANYDRPVLWITMVLWTVITGLILPVVEEMYFRGYLLPRMMGNKDIYGLAGNALVFTLYHAWHPFGWATVFLQGLLFAALVFWYRNYKLSGVLHVIGNLQLRVMVLFALVAG